MLKGENFVPARNITETIKLFLENLDSNIQEYKVRALDTIKQLRVDHQFYLNQVQYLITNRILDYVHIFKELSNQIFGEFIINITISKHHKDHKNKTKKEIANLLNALTLQ